jgi:hypothetical protein
MDIWYTYILFTFKFKVYEAFQSDKTCANI